MESQITTKAGDTGFASTLGGEHVAKSHPVMACVGTLDEACAHLARLRLRMLEENPARHRADAEFLYWLLHACFLLGAQCSDHTNKHPEYRKRDLVVQDVERLETEQARLEAQTPLPHRFVVSASILLSADADVARTVVRRFERALIALKEAAPEFPSEVALRFANRMSDYLFVLARHLEHPRHEVVDYSVLGL